MFRLLPISVFCIVLCTSCNRQPAQPQSRLTAEEVLAKIVLARHYHETGLGFEDETIKDFNKAIAYYDSAVSERTVLIDHIEVIPVDSIDSVLLWQFKSLTNIGNCYYNLKKYDIAKEATQRTIDFIAVCSENKYEVPPHRIAKAYQLLGQINSDISGLQDALLQYKTAINFFEQAKYTASVAGVHNDLSELYVNWRQPDSTIYYADKALKYYQLNNEDNDSADIERAANNLAIGYKNKGLYTLAFETNELAREHVKENDNSEMAKINHNRAKILRGLRRYKQAHIAVDSAIHLHTLLGETEREKLAGDYSNKAEIYIDENQGQLAYEFAERAIQTFLNKTGRVSVAALFAAGQTPSYISDKANFLEALKAKAKSLATLNKLEEAQQAYNEAIVVIDRFRFSFPDNNSKLQLAEASKQIFEGAIALAYRRNNIQLALQYAEKSKAFVLWESVKRKQLTAQNDAPIYSKFNQLATEIAELDRKIIKAEADEKRALLRQQSANQLTMQNLQAELEKDPQYLRTVELFNPLSVKDIQDKLLDPDQLMAEFFVGDSSSFVFFVNKQQSPQMELIPVTREVLLQKTENLLWSIQAEGGLPEAQKKLAERFPAQDARSVYQSEASVLFQLLFPKAIQESLTGEQSRLLIVPDDFLGYLPFDALLTAPPSSEIADYHNLNYLGILLPLSYTYSATLLKEMQDNRNSRSGRGMLAFAYQNPNDHFAQQVESISSILGKSYVSRLSNKSIKKQFKKRASRYSIIHLATHGRVDDRDPGYSHLLLADKASKQDSALYLYDLYDLRLRASLVFTSACDAGIGKLYRGEGLMSLARGFSLAGAGSIITTIWKINQEKQNTLVSNFYEQLGEKSGMSTDAVLFKAKKKYLTNINQPKEAAPYYWAGLIPVGDMQAIQLNTVMGFGWLYWLILPALVVLGYLFIRKRLS